MQNPCTDRVSPFKSTHLIFYCVGIISFTPVYVTRSVYPIAEKELPLTVRI
jgi:hypothetical protein